jgi:hypothetical protein
MSMGDHLVYTKNINLHEGDLRIVSISHAANSTLGLIAKKVVKNSIVDRRTPMPEKSFIYHGAHESRFF